MESSAGNVRQVYAMEPMDRKFYEYGIFLCGPTPRTEGPKSYRKQFVETFAKMVKDSETKWVIYIPEFRDGTNKSEKARLLKMNVDKVDEDTILDFSAQALWELQAISKSHVVMFYLGIEEKLMPGLVTRTEFGFAVGSKYCLSICAPEEAYRIRYLKILGPLEGYDICTNLEDSMKNIIKMCDHRTSRIMITTNKENSTLEVKKDCCNSAGNFDAINYLRSAIEKAVNEFSNRSIYVRFPQKFFNIIGLLLEYKFKFIRAIEDDLFEYYLENYAKDLS